MQMSRPRCELRGEARRRVSLRETWKCKSGLPIVTSKPDGHTAWPAEPPHLLSLFWFLVVLIHAWWNEKRCNGRCSIITLTYPFPVTLVNVNAPTSAFLMVSGGWTFRRRCGFVLRPVLASQWNKSFPLNWCGCKWSGLFESIFVSTL